MCKAIDVGLRIGKHTSISIFVTARLASQLSPPLVNPGIVLFAARLFHWKSLLKQSRARPCSSSPLSTAAGRKKEAIAAA